MARKSRKKSAPGRVPTNQSASSWSTATKIQLVAIVIALAMLGLLVVTSVDFSATQPAAQTGASAAAESGSAGTVHRGGRDERPPVSIEPTLLDVGTLKPREVVTETAHITNTGSEPLRIARSSASCGCTTLDLSDTLILPGRSVPLTVEFDARESPGVKVSTVTLLFDGYNTPIRYRVRGEVVEAN